MTVKKYIADNAALMQDWDLIRNSNAGLDPNQLTEGSNKRVWWKCVICGNEWETQIIKRAVRGQGCPICARQKQNVQQAERIKERIRTEGSFGDKHPELLDEWDYEKNKNTPYDFLAYSQEQVFWTCSKCGYQWKSSISSRSAGHGCRQCGRQEGKKTLVRNLIAVKGSLADNNPDLAAEWHPTKNGNLTPRDVTRSANKKAWWLGTCGHEWEAVIGSRHLGRGCPVCVREFKISYPEKWLKDKVEMNQRIDALSVTKEYYKLCQEVQQELWSSYIQLIHKDLSAIFSILPLNTTNIYNVSIVSDDQSVSFPMGQIVAQFLKKAAHQCPSFILDSYVDKF